MPCLPMAGEKKTNKSNDKCRNAQPMKSVPFLMFSSRFLRKRIRTQTCHPIVDRHEKQYRKNNHHRPDDAGNNKKTKAGFMMPKKGFEAKKKKTHRIPEGHRRTESLRKQANSRGLCTIIKLPHGWVMKTETANSTPINNPMQTVVTISRKYIHQLLRVRCEQIARRWNGHNDDASR